MTFRQFREEVLRSARRHPDHRVMLYRPTWGDHVRRVKYLVDALLPIVHPTHGRLNVNLARCIAEVHNDVDITSENGIPLRPLTWEEFAQRTAGDREYLRQKPYSSDAMIHGHEYRTLLPLVHDRRLPEAQLVFLCDTLDGIGETCHELYAGNTSFKGRYDTYQRQLGIFTPPGFVLTFTDDHPLLQWGSLGNPIENGRPFTRETITQDTGCPPYNFWRQVVRTYDGLDALVRQKEFPPKELAQ